MVTSLNTLVGGLDSLLDGAQTLSNRIEQFDNEGINKIATLVNDKVKPTSMKDMGLIMKELTPIFKGKADMKTVNEIVRSKLN